ncbi:MAG: DUF4426 domain-containing protein [Gammaproteobacteria bacterium]
MHIRRRPSVVLLTALICVLLPLAVSAVNSQDFGEHVVHFNALITNTLPPSVTRQYGITRSQNRAMLNVTVLKKVMGMSGEPVHASIKASAVNLTGQRKHWTLRKIEEGNAIYYIAEFRVANEETLDFDIRVQPEGLTRTLRVRFRRQFYTR